MSKKLGQKTFTWVEKVGQEMVLWGRGVRQEAVIGASVGGGMRRIYPEGRGKRKTEEEEEREKCNRC